LTREKERRGRREGCLPKLADSNCILTVEKEREEDEERKRERGRKVVRDEQPTRGERERSERVGEEEEAKGAQLTFAQVGCYRRTEREERERVLRLVLPVGEEERRGEVARRGG
jgi:hypothetical protein